MSTTYVDRHGYAPREHVNHGVHGNGRRPEPEFVVDPAALAEWTARNDRARRAYYAKPNACTAALYKGGY